MIHCTVRCWRYLANGFSVLLMTHLFWVIYLTRTESLYLRFNIWYHTWADSTSDDTKRSWHFNLCHEQRFYLWTSEHQAVFKRTHGQHLWFILTIALKKRCSQSYSRPSPKHQLLVVWAFSFLAELGRMFIFTGWLSFRSETEARERCVDVPTGYEETENVILIRYGCRMFLHWNFCVFPSRIGKEYEAKGEKTKKKKTFFIDTFISVSLLKCHLFIAHDKHARSSSNTKQIVQLNVVRRRERKWMNECING